MPSSSAARRRLSQRERLVDTLMLARRSIRAGSNRLDDLCARYAIDNSRRTKHGALLDAELLAEVYVELIGARQATLGLVAAIVGAGEARGDRDRGARAARSRLPPRIAADERDAHRAFVATLGDNGDLAAITLPAAVGSLS